MGLFDIFGGKTGALKKHAARAANKRAQNPDRFESLVTLAEMKSEEAVKALLPRFSIRVDPSITDQEEKDVAFQGCVAAGDAAIEPTKAFLRSADSISWPLKILEQLLPAEAVVTELLGLLSTFDTDYERDPRRKIQVVAYLEDRRDPRVAGVVQPFLEDMNDEVRFHAVGVLLAQENADEARASLTTAFGTEESVRVRVRIADGFVDREWTVETAQADAFRSRLPDGYALDPSGRVRK